MLLDDLRQRFVDAGYRVSPRDDVDVDAAAWFFGKKRKTLDNWRSAKTGPAFIDIGRCIRYPLLGLVEHLEQRVKLAQK